MRLALANILMLGRDCLAETGVEWADSVGKLLSLNERLQQGHLHLAVLGQFKRGKSTLLNALLGEALLPASVVPLTSIPTFISAGPAPAARVIHLNGQKAEEFSGDQGQTLTAFLARYVTEEANPENRLGVSHVEVLHPAPILRKGVVFIDTPGIGSTFRHNTQATLNFLPQCDAALFVVSADPPITEVEVEFLKEARNRVPRLFYILNKVDYLGEADRQTAVVFLRRVLTDVAGIAEDTPIFCLSAAQGLEARRAGDSALWASSGAADIETHLVEFLAAEKTQALHEAIAGKARTILDGALLRMRMEARSMSMPLDRLESCLRIFETKLEQAELQRQAARDMLAGDRRRTQNFLEDLAERLREKSRQYLAEEIRGALAASGGGDNASRIVQEVLRRAIPPFFEHEAGEFSRALERRIAEALRPHEQRMEELIASLRSAAEDLFDAPRSHGERLGGFGIKQRPYWVTHHWDSAFGPLPISGLDRLLPSRLGAARLMRQAMKRIESLAVQNVENLRWAMLQNLNDAFRQFESNLDALFSETITSTHGAVTKGRAKRLEHAAEIAGEVARLEAASSRVAELRDLLGSPKASEAAWEGVCQTCAF